MSGNIVKKEEASLSIAKSPMKGFFIPSHELPLPGIKLVHPTTSDAIDQDGNNVPAGNFINIASKKNLGDSFSLRILGVGQGEIPDYNDETKIVSVYNLVGVEADTNKVFFMMITGSSRWTFRNYVLPVVHSQGDEGKEIFDTLITAQAAQTQNQKGNKYWLIEFKTDTTKPVDEKTRNILTNLQDSYAEAANKTETIHEEDETVEALEASVEDFDKLLQG